MSQKRTSLHCWFVPGKEKCPPSGLLSELSVCVCVCVTVQQCFASAISQTVGVQQGGVN